MSESLDTPEHSPEHRVGEILLDHVRGLLVVWTGYRWELPETLDPGRFDKLIHGIAT